MLAAWLALAGAGPVLPCDDAMWDVIAADPGERALACSGLRAAAEFLGACGMVAPGADLPAVRVRVVDALPSSCGQPIHGSFDVLRNEIVIGSLAVCAALPAPESLFALLPAEMAFRSVATHEAAHALLDRAGLDRSAKLVHEYIAAVTQYAALPDEARRSVIAASGARPAEHPRQINLFLFAMVPHRFRAVAWMHFEAQADGCGHLRALATGAARLPDLSEF